MLAAASDAIVIGFAVDSDNAAERLADREGVSIRLYTIIYRLIEDIEKALLGMLEPEMVEKVTRWVKEVVDIPVLVKLTPNITNIFL